MDLPFEGKRILFLIQRDGEQAAIDFVLRTYPLYRLSLKRGLARDKVFRRGYIESCIDFRKFLRAHGRYTEVLTKIKYS